MTGTVGTPGYRYETGWIDLGNPERRKAVQYIDLVFQPQSAGSMKVSLYRDFDDATLVAASEGSDTFTLTVRSDEGYVGTRTPQRVVYPLVHCQHVKLVVESVSGATSVDFDMSGIVWRVSDDDQT